MKKLVASFAVILILSGVAFVTPSKQALAHRDGCHRWHSCPSDSGSYVCGDLGYTSECGAMQSAPAQPVYREPVKTQKNIVETSPIKFEVITKFDAREYPEFEKIAQAGVEGTTTITTVVNYTDGVETSREPAISTVTQKPLEQVLIKGVRTHSPANIQYVWKTKANKGKYDIVGSYQAGKRVVLFLNKKKVANALCDKNGYFIFSGIPIKSRQLQAEIFKAEGSKLSSISEKTMIDFSNKKFLQEYDLLHGKKL